MRLGSRPLAAYITIVVLLSCGAFLPNFENDAAYYALTVIGLPISLVALVVTYVLAIIVNSADDYGYGFAVVVIAIWVVLIAAQAIALYQAFGSRRARAS